MKIGIATFHNTPNYGAVLQAFALLTYLKGRGHDVNVIDYLCAGNDESFSPNNIEETIKKNPNFIKRTIKIFLFSFFVKKEYSKKYKKFKDFQHSFLNLCSFDTKDFDAVFFGSDQIWNPRITHGFKPFYFGADTSSQTIAASFAASCGDVSTVSSEEDDFYSNLCNLDYIGVREKGLYNYIRSLGLNCSLTLDPTLLLNKEDYIKELNLQKTSDAFILVYELHKNKELDIFAQQLSKKTGLKIKKVCGFLPFDGKKNKGFFDFGPIDFLELLYNSKYVITNSFHGIALSIIFEKNFNVVLPNFRSERITDFLSMLSLQNRIVSLGKSDFSNIDYSHLSNEFIQSVTLSKKYLNSILEGGQNG